MLRDLLTRELSGPRSVGPMKHDVEILDASIIYPSIITHPPVPSRIRHQSLRYYGISIRPAISLLSVFMNSSAMASSSSTVNFGEEEEHQIMKIQEHLHCSKTHTSMVDELSNMGGGGRSFLSGGIQYALRIPKECHGKELLIARGPKSFHICLDGSLQNTEKGTEIIAVLPITKSHSYVAIRSCQEYCSFSMHAGFIGLGDVSDADDHEWVPELQVQESTTMVSRFTLHLKTSSSSSHI